MSNPGIYVCGTPRGGTSCVAGILHHLGVDMGKFRDGPDSAHGYTTFEDMQAPKFTRPLGRHPGDSTLKFMAGANSGRDFRAYLEMREKQANGKQWGCKLGTNYPMSDPDPASLPVRWVFVDRPLEVCIRSDVAKTKPDDPVERAMQIAGYWAAKETLAAMLIARPIRLWFRSVVSLPNRYVKYIIEDLKLSATPKQVKSAVRFIQPSLVSKWAG